MLLFCLYFYVESLSVGVEGDFIEPEPDFALSAFVLFKGTVVSISV